MNRNILMTYKDPGMRYIDFPLSWESYVLAYVLWNYFVEHELIIIKNSQQRLL